MKGADQCPRCGSRKTADLKQPVTKFYAATLRTCGNPACHTTWEPFDPAQMLDPKHEPLGAFLQPCNNCAFRKGSPEQADTIAWRKKLHELHQGALFYCHKGVPIAPKSENGFAYPEGGKNPRKLRLCRGYLNAIVGPRMRGAGYQFQTGPDEPWRDPADAAHSVEAAA